MLPIELANAMIIVAVFVLRLGVPVAVTLALGCWLEKWLRPPAEETPDTRRRMRSFRGALRTGDVPPHCWDRSQEQAARNAEGAAVRHPDLPCWLALQVEGYPLRPECFMCARYRSHANVA